MRTDQRGAAMAEYLPLLAVIAAVIFFAVTYFGGQVRDLLGGECPPGWELTMTAFVDSDKKTAIERDRNDDGFVCVKAIPGQGEGNSGLVTNIKDNT